MTPTFVAARQGHAECIDALARHGADVNRARTVRVGPCAWVVYSSLTGRLSGGEQDGETPTYVAASNGHVECIEMLARHGADVNEADEVSAGPVRAE